MAHESYTASSNTVSSTCHNCILDKHLRTNSRQHHHHYASFLDAATDAALLAPSYPPPYGAIVVSEFGAQFDIRRPRRRNICEAVILTILLILALLFSIVIAFTMYKTWSCENKRRQAWIVMRLGPWKNIVSSCYISTAGLAPILLRCTLFNDCNDPPETIILSKGDCGHLVGSDRFLILSRKPALYQGNTNESL
jgi:hypothetical protein